MSTQIFITGIIVLSFFIFRDFWCQTKMDEWYKLVMRYNLAHRYNNIQYETIYPPVLMVIMVWKWSLISFIKDRAIYEIVVHYNRYCK